MKPYYYVYDPKELATHGDKFDSADKAEQLALELATKYPGSAFEILRCVGIAQTTKASTFWMDGEGPLHPLATMRADWPGIDREEPPEKPRYRELEDGEDFQEGDEWQPFPGIEWLKVPYYSLGEIYHKSAYPSPHRRPL